MNFFKEFYLLSGVSQLVFQLLDPCRQGLLAGLFSRFTAVVPAKVCKAFIAVGVGSELVGKAPDSLVAENFRGDPVLLEDGAHGPSLHQQPVGFPLEFRREVDPSGDDADDIRTGSEFSEFFGVEFFSGHRDLPFGPDRFEHYYTRIEPTRECPRVGVSPKSRLGVLCPRYGVSAKPPAEPELSTAWGLVDFYLSTLWGCAFCWLSTERGRVGLPYQSMCPFSGVQFRRSRNPR